MNNENFGFNFTTVKNLLDKFYEDFNGTISTDSSLNPQINFEAINFVMDTIFKENEVQVLHTLAHNLVNTFLRWKTPI